MHQYPLYISSLPLWSKGLLPSIFPAAHNRLHALLLCCCFGENECYRSMKSPVSSTISSIKCNYHRSQKHSKHDYCQIQQVLDIPRPQCGNKTLFSKFCGTEKYFRYHVSIQNKSCGFWQWSVNAQIWVTLANFLNNTLKAKLRKEKLKRQKNNLKTVCKWHQQS